MSINWNDWILEKNNAAKEESLKKSDSVSIEELEKAANHLPFEHGSHITIHRAVTDPENGKTHGYEVHEKKADGSNTVHPNVKYNHLDSKMTHGRLRMGGENATKQHNLYHSATVRTAKRRDTNGKVSRIMELHPHGDPHTIAENHKK